MLFFLIVGVSPVVTGLLSAAFSRIRADSFSASTRELVSAGPFQNIRLSIQRLSASATAEVSLFTSRRMLGSAFAAPADASQHVLLDLHADLPLFRYFLDARSAREIWQFRAVQHLGAIAAVRSRVLEGAGIAVLPLYFVRQDLQKKHLVRLMSKTKLPSDWFRLVWRTGHAREAELRQIASELCDLPLR